MRRKYSFKAVKRTLGHERDNERERKVTGNFKINEICTPRQIL
jgi:hypothetical protein